MSVEYRVIFKCDEYVVHGVQTRKGRRRVRLGSLTVAGPGSMESADNLVFEGRSDQSVAQILFDNVKRGQAKGVEVHLLRQTETHRGFTEKLVL